MADPGVQAPIHKNWKTTLPRIYNFIEAKRFREVNLMGRLYGDSRQVTLSHWALPGGEGAWQEWTFDDVVQQTFTPCSIGNTFGPTWTTHWFKVEFSIPDEWASQEVRLRWKSGTEATVWTQDGKLMQGLSTGTSYQKRPDYILTSSYPGGAGSQVLYIEMVASRLFGNGQMDDIDPPPPDVYYTLEQAEIAVFDTQVYKLTRDLEVLHQMADNLQSDARGYQALFTANQMVNSIIKGDDSVASGLADYFFQQGNGARAHQLVAIGNCHIDSAWLWPFSETKRKVGRSFSSQLGLMETYAEHKFVASQAQQWSWCKQYYPELFERIKEKVAEGKFLPVGSTWVEMDGNIPSGESFIRQFLHGQRFYQQEFGYTCKEFWLPDTFGYSAQIPALMHHMGLKRFLTQKLSWSLVNKFPHHNFTWEGIDGSAVLAHFPPGDSYEMNCTVTEALKTINNLQDKGRVDTSAFLFGYGDGGGGPTQDQLERLRRMKDVDGIPKMDIMTPDDLFNRLEPDQHNMCRWVGELFLELHNGTYTTQSDMKRLCRQAEFRLRDAEFMLSSAVANNGPGSLLSESLNELDPAWKKVLLNQFHDVLPGSGIGIIYPEATTQYAEAIQAADNVWQQAADNLFGSDANTSAVFMNTLQWERSEVVGIQALNNNQSQICDERAKEYALFEVPPFGYASTQATEPTNTVTVSESNGLIILDNGLVHAEINSVGQVVSLYVVGDDRDVFKKVDGTQLAGNKMILFDDQPVYWDAWDIMDYHLETGKLLNNQDSGQVITPPVVVSSDPIMAKVQWGVTISDGSTITQIIELTANSPYLTFDTSVNWHENRKFLKVMFDTNIFTRNASFDIQFGHLERPNHMNTSWDSARYEVCGHKWADLSETGWGMAVLNNSKYGWYARGNQIMLSLLKSPKAPDDQADMGNHTFRYAVMPHLGTLQEAGIVRRAYEFNNPLRQVQISTATMTAQPTWTMGTVDGTGAMLHTIKPTEDGNGDILLRMYECKGSKSKVTVKLSLPVTGVFTCNGMEEAGEPVDFTQDDGVTSIPLTLAPFVIRALRLTF